MQRHGLRPSLRRLGTLAAAIAVLVGLTTPALAEPPRIYAITHANVVPAPGELVEDGTVVLRDGLVAAVGAGIDVPADATEIDATGRWVYPGLIDADTSLALVSSGGAESRASGGPSAGGRPARDAATPGAVHPLARVRPERRVRDRLLPFEGDRKREMQRMRELGFTTVLASPGKGLFRGRSAAIQLADDRPVAELILRDDVAQHLALERGSFGEGYPTSLMGAMAAIRQTLLDAQRYGVWSRRYENDPVGLRRPDHHAAHEALAPVLDGDQPVHFHVNDPDDTLLADRIGDEFDLNVVVSVSGPEWEIAEQVAATGRALLLPVAFPEKPKVKEDAEALAISRRTMRRYVEAASGPGRLHEAGVRFALTTRDLKNTADFPKQVREIIEGGLPRDVALAALTTTPAEILGLAAVLGSVREGKIANVLIATGPLFEEDTELTDVFVDGVRHEVEKSDKPKGDPNAVVDPRGEWSVVYEFGSRTIQRTWTITGERDDYGGTGETRSGVVTFDSVELEGNAMTVTFPGEGERGPMSITVIVEGDSFEGSAEMGPRSIPVEGTRTRGPGGDGR